MGSSLNPMQASARNAAPNSPEPNPPKATDPSATFRESGAGTLTALAVLVVIATLVILAVTPVQSQPADKPAAAASAVTGASAPASASPEASPVVTLVFMQGKLEAIANAIEAQTARQIDVFGKAKGMRVDIIAKDCSLEDALDRIAEPSGLVWWQYDTRKYAIADFETYADMTLREPDLDTALKHLAEKYNCVSSKDPAGAIRITLPAAPRMIRCGPAAVAQSLGIEIDAAAASDANAAGKAEPEVTLVFNQGKIEQVVMALSQQAQTDIHLRGGAQGRRVDVIVKEQPLSRGLDAICAQGDLVWWQTPDGDYSLSPKTFFQKDVLGNEQLMRLLNVVAQGHGRIAKKVSDGADGWVVELVPQPAAPVQPTADDSSNLPVAPAPSTETK